MGRLQKLIATAAVAAMGILATAGAALAVDATARSALNVRSGPGPGHSIVDTLRAGERVDVRRCTASGSWCYITHSGPDGWVYARYLNRLGTGSVPTPNDGPPVHFGIYVGPDGPSMSFGIGQPAPTPRRAVACFYGQPNYGGARFCARAGSRYTHLGAWNDRISSVRVFNGATVRMCRNVRMGGFCRTTGTNIRRLGPILNNEISSLRVY